jgi:uncharacterized damage-inducible protein DinB
MKMQLGDIRFLFAYDRWATRRVLAALEGIDEATWSAPNTIGERGLGGILVHQLGAHGRWRIGLSGGSGRFRPEREPLPTIAELRSRWEAEWQALDAWLDTIDEATLARVDEDGVPWWQCLAHVVNHGTQHRGEAAALLTGAGAAPGDLDMIDFASERAAPGG